MRRLSTVARPASPRICSTFRFLIVAMLAALGPFAFASVAAAQSGQADTPNGLMSPDEAGTGTLLLKTSTPGRYLQAPRVGTDVNVHVSGAIARTKITQRFENPAEGWVEGEYVFPLPDGAAVDTMKMQIGNRFLEGKIKERQEARRIYEAAKAQGVKTSLIEQQRPNVFTNRVANIGPHEVVVVQIEYQESLRFDQGRYHLRVPLVVAPRYAPPAQLIAVGSGNGQSQLTAYDPVPDRHALESPVLRPEMGKLNPVRLVVELEAGFPLGAIESENIPVDIVRNSKTEAVVSLRNIVVPADRDFSLSFAPSPGAMPSISLLKEHEGDNDYLLALVVPPSASGVAASKPREAIFVLDNSGSMAGESIREAKASLLLALDRLTPADRFNVIRFDDTLTVLFSHSVDATAENVAFAKSFVSSIDAAGGTEMLPALQAALNDPTPEDRSRLRQVIFLTDGGVANEAALFSAIGEKLGRSRLFTVGIGSSPNGYFMSGAARAGRGTYTYIGSTDDVQRKMAELLAKLQRPVMTDLTAQWPDGADYEAWPNPLPDLYAGEPILVTAKATHASGQLVLSGNLGGKPWQAVFDLSAAHPAEGIEKLWARNKISSLEDSRVQGADATAIDKSVLEVALAHHLTSRLTSLVAVDVTPSRTMGTPLTTQQVPLNLPAGWDFDKVFGGGAMRSDIPAGMIRTLSIRRAAGAAVEPDDAGLSLPQSGSESPMLLLAGVALLLLAFLTMCLRLPPRRLDV